MSSENFEVHMAPASYVELWVCGVQDDSAPLDLVILCEKLICESYFCFDEVTLFWNILNSCRAADLAISISLSAFQPAFGDWGAHISSHMF